MLLVCGREVGKRSPVLAIVIMSSEFGNCSTII